MTRFAPFAYEPSARRAANGDRKPLLRKGSETTARVAGFGLAIGGVRPSNTSWGSLMGCQPTARSFNRCAAHWVYATLSCLRRQLPPQAEGAFWFPNPPPAQRGPQRSPEGARTGPFASGRVGAGGPQPKRPRLLSVHTRGQTTRPPIGGRVGCPNQSLV